MEILTKEQKDLLADFLDSIRDYERESHNLVGFDERETSEFVEIYEGVLCDRNNRADTEGKLILAFVSGSLPSEEQLMELSEIDDKYMYEGVNDDIHIGCKGITAIIKEWDKMRQ